MKRWWARPTLLPFHNTLDQTRDVMRRVMEGQHPKTSARDAYETMCLCFAAEQSADLAKTVHLEEVKCGCKLVEIV